MKSMILKNHRLKPFIIDCPGYPALHLPFMVYLDTFFYSAFLKYRSVLINPAKDILILKRHGYCDKISNMRISIKGS